MDAQDKRVAAILGEIEDITFDETIGVFYEYLKTHLSLPCKVTGIEDFRWEEVYVFGPGDQGEYDHLKQTQPSYTDHYELLGIDRECTPEWVMCWEDDIGARVRRVSDGKQFVLGLSELKATDKKSGNYRFLDDYSVWFANNR
ncbi:MAG: hypothetical protein P8Z79_25455 [Sedimentisphaerales bacterium]|jgi:hypothetical protein